MNALLLAAAALSPQQFAPPDAGRVRRYGIDFGADIQLEFRQPRVYRYPDPPRAMPYAANGNGYGGGYPGGYAAPAAYGGCGGGYAAPSGYGYGTGPRGAAYEYSYGRNGGGYPVNGGGYYAAPGGYGAGVGPAGRPYSYSYGGNGYAAAPATFETRQRRPGPDGY